MIISYAYEEMMYTWTAHKEKLNIKKHGISFKTAIRIFDNDITYDEKQIVDGEERWKTVGPVSGSMLTVISAERSPNIRIISAWASTSEEIKQYLKLRKKHMRRKGRYGVYS